MPVKQREVSCGGPLLPSSRRRPRLPSAASTPRAQAGPQRSESHPDSAGCFAVLSYVTWATCEVLTNSWTVISPSGSTSGVLRGDHCDLPFFVFSPMTFIVIRLCFVVPSVCRQSARASQRCCGDAHTQPEPGQGHSAPLGGDPRGSPSRAPHPPMSGRVPGSAVQAPRGRSLPRRCRPQPEAFEAAAPRGPSRGGPGLQLPASNSRQPPLAEARPRGSAGDSDWGRGRAGPGRAVPPWRCRCLRHRGRRASPR